MDQAHSEFLIELEEQVEKIYVDLDALRDPGLDGRGRRDLIDRIFRRIHSVKGSSASCGLNALSQIAHEFENLLDAARVGRVVLDKAALDTCDSAVDALSESLSLAANGIVEPSRQQLFERLQSAARGKSSHADDEILKTIPGEIWQTLTEPEKSRLAAAVREGTRLFLISTSFEIETFDEQFFRLKEKLAAWGEVISTSPTVDDLHQDQINFRVLYASAMDASLVTNLREFPNAQLKPIESVNDSHSPKLEAPFSSVSPIRTSISSGANFVRTDLDTLDRLISNTHELFRQTSNALDLAITETNSANLQSLNEELKASFLSVQDELINLRMVSIGPTLQRAVRGGRTAARLAGKEIDFEVTGGNLRLDKLLADAIADPLIHLIRNAVDHGLEDAETRARAGKNGRGTVRISASSDGGRPRVSVSDDGRGIDPELVSAAAKRLGIVEAETPLDFERSLRLIFRPGFTTVDSVSNLSGRGVGLDVVETAVEQAGGELRVSSKPGVGTIFEIRLPVTFGLMEAKVVVSAGQRYCIAASQTLTAEDALTDAASVTEAQGVAEIPLRELLGQRPVVTQTVSLRTEATNAAESNKNSSPAAHLITCLLSDERDVPAYRTPKSVRIAVDEIEGTEKVLVRSLGRHAGRWHGVAGATELRDGSVALVLDLPRLLGEFVKSR
ncbi:MAG TPA: ATP-binding protein [Pyrinomonadaceae bacterium]|nr:ATP-binding protein [Pyrinomonadaceae bacterium]